MGKIIFFITTAFVSIIAVILYFSIQEIQEQADTYKKEKLDLQEKIDAREEIILSLEKSKKCADQFDDVYQFDIKKGK